MSFQLQKKFNNTTKDKEKCNQMILQTNIIIPEKCYVPMNSNEIFDDFILYIKKYMKNTDNHERFNMAKNENTLLSFLAIHFINATGLPVHMNLEDFKNYPEE